MQCSGGGNLSRSLSLIVTAALEQKASPSVSRARWSRNVPWLQLQKLGNQTCRSSSPGDADTLERSRGECEDGTYQRKRKKEKKFQENSKRPTWRHVIKLSKVKDKEILKAEWEKLFNAYKGSSIILADFPSESLQARRQWAHSLKLLKRRKNSNPVTENPISGKTIFKSERDVRRK